VQGRLEGAARGRVLESISPVDGRA